MAVYTRGRARRSLIDTVMFRALSQIATVAGYIVMVRGMAKEDFGVFNLLYAFIPVISTVASLGLEQTLRRYQPQGRSLKATTGLQGRGVRGRHATGRTSLSRYSGSA